MVSEHRDEAAAAALFKRVIYSNGFPNKGVIDKSGANYTGIENINTLLLLTGLNCFIDLPGFEQSYLNKITGSSKITKLMMGLKAFHSAQATIDGIETAHIIRKRQLFEEIIPA